jgi:hypothetical protein
VVMSLDSTMQTGSSVQAQLEAIVHRPRTSHNPVNCRVLPEVPDSQSPLLLDRLFSTVHLTSKRNVVI